MKDRRIVSIPSPRLVTPKCSNCKSWREQKSMSYLVEGRAMRFGRCINLKSKFIVCREDNKCKYYAARKEESKC